jgi:hypothetical protein
MTTSNDAEATMKAVRIHSFGGPEELHYEDAPRPAPKDGLTGNSLPYSESLL